MGFDPGSIALIASAVAGGYSAYTASKNKPPEPKPVSPPATEVGDTEPTRKTARKYRGPAQLFRDDDLLLGKRGTLGGVVG